MSMQTQTNLALVTSVGVVQQVEGITTDLKQYNAIIQYNKHINSKVFNFEKFRPDAGTSEQPRRNFLAKRFLPKIRMSARYRVK